MVEVPGAEAIPDGGHLIAKVGGREILIARWNGRVYAMRNICPHQSQSFECGVMRARIAAETPSGELKEMADRPIITCPWHGWDFELATGRCTADAGYRIRTYSTCLRNGKVCVDLDARSGVGID